MGNVRQFHFTLGPVQGFVAQARRTRDFWAGSFLLSWLSGVAMAAAEAQGGRILFPIPPENYLRWIRGEGVGNCPLQGGIPNRFKAEVPEDFDGDSITAAVRSAWQALSDHVWEADLKTIAGEATRDIWDRQHRHFWEMAWAMDDSAAGDASDLLDRRKNWRSHLPPPEPGAKCFLMEGWQELSGVVGVSARDNQTRDGFWKKVRESVGGGDLAENEQLCALAFVKRRFVRHFQTFASGLSLTQGRSLPLRGWTLPSNQPSVVYMAAVRWLEALLKRCSADAADREVIGEIVKLGNALADRGEWQSRITALVAAAEVFDGREKQGDGRKLIALDGSVFFDALREAELVTEDARKKAATFTHKLNGLIQKHQLGQPTPFYAVLLMDGDSLGEHMRLPENQKAIPPALDMFTKSADACVRRHNGHLIYAGGDDVLAILPLEDALDCAASLRGAYLEAFAKNIPEGRKTPLPTTLSGAIIYAHIKMPLGEVLRQSHTVLDDVAKEGAGRDAIAVRVLKPGGENLTWAQPWARLRTDDAPDTLLPHRLCALFQQAEAIEPGFSSKFFYKVRERLSLLEGVDENGRPAFSDDARVALVRADFMASARTRKIVPEDLDTHLSLLLRHCTPHVRRRSSSPGGEDTFDASPLDPQGMMFIRFLAHKGVEVR